MPAETVRQVLDRILARGRRLQLRGAAGPEEDDEADTSGARPTQEPQTTPETPLRPS